MKTMKTLKIGIADYDEMKARTLAIARGEHKPAEGEPTVWFTSVKRFGEALSRHTPEVGSALSAATTCSRSRR